MGVIPAQGKAGTEHEIFTRGNVAEVPQIPERRALSGHGRETTLSNAPDNGFAGLPARVRAEIAVQEAQAERLIGWVQLAVVVFFATLYALAPMAEGGSGRNFVPLTLAAYFLFTVLRVVLSYRMTLPRWYLIVSIVVDVMLLCGLIFSFHIQYGQHPAFYLKAPTLMYLFLFISLRALRFDPRFVLLTGLIGAAGWLAMLAYAVLADMGEMRITRNYVEYLTSNSILVGAEIDKILTILGVTAILSLALVRGRRLLFDAIRGNAAANDLRQFFSPEVARTITGSDHLPAAGRGETCHAAILMVDVRSFTTTAELLAPETVMQVLTRYQQIALPIIEEQGGRIDKFLGDGILATFGAVQPSETFAADALRAAMAVIEAVDVARHEFSEIGWPGAFQIGAGVATGPVVVGVVGALGRFEHTVIGNAVNRAAKLEGANKALGVRVLTDGESLALARAQGFAGTPIALHRERLIEGMGRRIDLMVMA